MYLYTIVDAEEVFKNLQRTELNRQTKGITHRLLVLQNISPVITGQLGCRFVGRGQMKSSSLLIVKRGEKAHESR